MKITLHILSIFTFLIACTGENKEQQLLLREQQLAEKEKAFAAKEIEYEKLVALRDSLENEPTTPEITETLPEQIIGTWNGKMICTETNCADHAVGDQRTDIWHFTADGMKMVNKTGGERLFTGNMVGGELKLTSEPMENSVYSEITLDLTELSVGRIKGTRNLTGKNDCLAKFSVELEKVKK